MYEGSFVSVVSRPFPGAVVQGVRWYSGLLQDPAQDTAVSTLYLRLFTEIQKKDNNTKYFRQTFYIWSLALLATRTGSS